MTLFLLLWILYCMAEGFDHAWYNATNIARATLRRIAIGALVVYGMCGAGSPLVIVMNTALALIFIFALVYPLTYNKVKGEPIFYINSIGSLNRHLRKSPRLTWLLKLWFAVVSIVVLYSTHNTFIIRVTNLVNEWLF